MKRKRLMPDPYGADIWFLYGTAEELNKFFKRTTGADEEIAPGVRGHYTPHDVDGKITRYISIPTDRNRNRFDRIGVLCHEVTHAAMCILSDRGIKVSRKNDEAFAYYHEWLFRQCAREIW